MDMQLLVIGVSAVAIAAVAWFALRRQPTTPKSQRREGVRVMEGLDTLMSWEPEATRIMTAAERKAFTALHTGLPEHIVLAQVPLARFLKVPTRHSYSEWLRRVGMMCADLVVCDSASHVVAVVDIRAPESQENEKARQRHARMDRVLAAADITVHVWREDALPNALGARNAILGLPPDTPPPMALEPVTLHAVQPLHGTAPAAGARLSTAPFEGEHDGVERHDPPPSTWFDELDTAPAPLSPTPPRGSGPTMR